MKRYLLGLAAVVTGMTLWLAPPAGAVALKAAPLEYRTTLKKGESKQGFVDISNSATQPVRVSVSVQAFRQIDNNGSLQFYDDKQLRAGITPELTEFTLGSREAIRLYFTINGNSLQKGDNYGALFFTSEPEKAKQGVGQSVRVGTLFSIVNEEPGDRKAEVTNIDVPFFQLSSKIEGSYKIRNTGSKDSGFYPDVVISAWPPSTEKTISSSLVFGGRERINDFTYEAGIGLHRIDASFSDKTKSAWVLVLPAWLLLLIGLIVAVVGTELYLLHHRRRKRRSTS